MICFVVAFRSEARPILEYYGFKEMEKNPFPLFKSELGYLIISGMGRKNAARACSYVAGHIEPKPRVWINVGIAGHPTHPIGSAFLAREVIERTTGKKWLPEINFDVPCRTERVMTIDECETQYTEPHIYDMEAAAIFEAAARRSDSRVHCFKVISDNRNAPAKNVSPKFGGELIQKNIKILDQIVTCFTLKT